MSEGRLRLESPVAGTVVRIGAAPGDRVAAGAELVVVESMKTELEVVAPVDGIVLAVTVAVGEGVGAGSVVAELRGVEGAGAAVAADAGPDPDAVRPDLAEVHRRHALVRDDARPDAVRRRRARGQRTARENLDDLCDPGTLVEYGPLAVAAQLTRRPLEELVERTPADGLVCGLAEVNGARVGADRARTAVLAYDATVLAGTQGATNHRKKDRILEVALRKRLPVVLFAEGGGGRPGDVDVQSVAALDVPAFGLLARLSGTVPLVGIASGRCFAGNAALLGCCDVVIATEDATIGMGGPAMIEGGGLGSYAPEEVGPIDVQTANGVVDVRVADEAEATDVARRYLSYFQGPVADWTAPDGRALRHAVPERRTRAYDVHAVLEALADVGSVLELRAGYGASVVTALVRIEGRPYGLLANDPRHLGGAVDSVAADKAARFLGLCDAHGLPVVSLVDTPGFMVGPDAERTGSVRRMSRMFLVGANVSVPLCAIVLRKAYGLGAMAMCGGSTLAPLATVGWPTAELGAMGLEGAVKLGFRKELDAIEDPDERQARFDAMVELAYERGKGVSVATMFELDDVIDPVDTRAWIAATLGDVDARRPDEPPRRPNVDSW
ncbi:carboxyl transferase domain-containing protein [Patulibacter brassicae]|uniref:Carboxyl transferase domain-containing protein n=1 Tax=Patulibacter brassicae TaxID=1705717 RepID=A0ABU4VGR8_9ACTN|nr:carboxyl transferase domain-containing protein [Patulibacter brassicae]MDX8150136.1 carboxyl transferase domain-containing protein [Patulibacter brassicae]